MHQDSEIIEVVNETARVEKRDTVTGRVRVSTRTETVDDLVSTALERQDVEVTRIRLDEDIDVAPPVRTENGVTIIPVVEEVVVVEKRLVLREEIHIRHVTTTQSVDIPVSLRRQHAVIERDEVPAQSSEEDT